MLIQNMPLKFQYLNLGTNQTPPKIEKFRFPKEKYSYKKNYWFLDWVNADTKFRPWNKLSSHIITIPKNEFRTKIMAIQNSSKFRKTWKSPFWGLCSRLSFATYYTHWNQHHTVYIISKIWVPRSNGIDFGKVGSNSKFQFLGIKIWILRNFITDKYALLKCKSIAEYFDSIFQKSNFIWIFFKNLKMSTFYPNLKHDSSSVPTFFPPIPAT